ncbi:hypothetical protein pipiens_018023 [Culex pipiens pipiens]|uniref:Uncharacterized protein n=1 Tax=Culex pipiens pipiens TaxID=38569 RepID=A0ABD1CDT3_CULPP
MADTATGVASAAAAVGRTTYQWAGAGARMARDGTVYCYQKSKSVVQSLAGVPEEKTAQIESTPTNDSSLTTALGAVGNTTYQWAGTGAKLARDGTVYCYQKSRNAIVGLATSGEESIKADEAPSWRSLAGTTVAIAGAGTTSYLWLGAISSRVAKEALRAGCIRNSLCAMSTLSLPMQRSTAVFIGTRLNNYIVQGIVPGLFTAWAVYDTYRLGRWAYNWYYYPTVGQHEMCPKYIEFNKIAA